MAIYNATTGFSTGTVNGLQPSVLSAANIDLSGQTPAGQPGNCFSSDGQLIIGRSLPNAYGTNAQMGNITSSDGSINVINGPGTIDLRGQAPGFQPNAVLQEFDDFLGSTSNPGIAKLAWAASNVTMTAGTADHPGIYQTTDTFGATSGLYLGYDTGGTHNAPVVLGGGTTTITWVVQLSTLSTGGNSYDYYAGFIDEASLSAASEAIVSGVYFKYNHALNGGQWTINTTSASVTTTVNTSSVVSTGWTTLSIVVNAAASSASFYVNNILVGTAITTNIPSVAICPVVILYWVSGTTPTTLIDLFYLIIVLSNPRPGPTNPAITGANGRLILNYKATAISYQVLGTDAIIGVTSTAAPRTITMPNSSLNIGQQWEIKDESGGAAANNITINGNGSNIDGSATKVISTNYGSVQLYWSGTNFFIV